MNKPFHCYLVPGEQEIELREADKNITEKLLKVMLYAETTAFIGYMLKKDGKYISWQELEAKSAKFWTDNISLILIIETEEETKELTFGIEIEGNGISSLDDLIYKFNNSSLDNDWAVKADASITAILEERVWNKEYEYDDKGLELGKVFIKGDDTFELATKKGYSIQWIKENLPAAIHMIKKARHEMCQVKSHGSYKCGLHIHVGNIPPEHLRKIARYAVEYEETMFELFAPDPIREMFAMKFELGVEDGDYIENNLVERNCMRNVWLNFTSLDKHGTLEFRIFNGTLEIDEIVDRLKYVENFIKNAIESNLIARKREKKGERCIKLYAADIAGERAVVSTPIIEVNRNAEQFLEEKQFQGKRIRICSTDCHKSKEMDMLINDNYIAIEYPKNTVYSYIVDIEDSLYILIEFINSLDKIPKENLIPGDIDENLGMSANYDIRVSEVLHGEDNRVTLDWNNVWCANSETIRRYLQRHRWQKESIILFNSEEKILVTKQGFKLDAEKFVIGAIDGKTVAIIQVRRENNA